MRGGFSAYPPEVEAALASHPAILHCAAVGRPAGSGGEEVLAFCQADLARVAEGELHARAAQRLAFCKRPGQIVLAAVLPVSLTGKIFKSRLTEVFREALPPPKADARSLGFAARSRSVVEGSPPEPSRA